MPTAKKWARKKSFKPAEIIKALQPVQRFFLCMIEIKNAPLLLHYPICNSIESFMNQFTSALS
jgi:hypothetical protein